MPMAARGHAKLIEEMGELLQTCGKRLAYYTTDEHPDGGPPLRERLQDEIADVMAACGFVSAQEDLDIDYIEMRVDAKLALFNRWNAIADNNTEAIDATQ